MNADGDALAGNLLAGDTLDVDDVFETVDREDLTLLVLVRATDDLDLVALSDGDAADLYRRKSHVSSSNGGNFVGVEECRRTLYFSRSSLLNGALMMVRRTLEGAVKCALRDFRLEEWRAIANIYVSTLLCQSL